MMKKTKRPTKLQSRLFLLIGAVTAISALMIGFAVISLLRIRQEAQVMYLQSQNLDGAFEAITYIQQIDLAQNNMLTRRDDSGLDTHDVYSSNFDLYLQEAALDADTTEEKNTLELLSEEKSNYDQMFNKALGDIAKGPESINNQQFEELRQNVKQSTLSMYEHLYELIKSDTNQMVLARTRAAKRASLLMQSGIVALALFGLVAFVAVLAISRTVYQPILYIDEAIRRMRQGDFDPTAIEELAKRPDEMGKLASVFLDMARAVSDRKKNLIDQADELRAQIEKLSR